MIEKIKEWAQRVRWKLSFEYRMSEQGQDVRNRWLSETDPMPDDQWVDERGLSDR